MKFFRKLDATEAHLRRIYGPGYKPNELFGRTGLGPIASSDTWQPSEYKGQLYPEALRVANEPNLQPASVELCNRARRQWSLGRFGEAKESYEAARKLSPKNCDFPFEEAQLLWCLRDSEGAEALLSRSTSLSTTNNDRARIGLTILKYARRKMSEALEAFGKIENTDEETTQYVGGILSKYL